MQYFSHDTGASTDDKVMALRVFYGGAAVDCYWSVIERIYKDERPMVASRFTLASLAATLGTTSEQVSDWLDGMREVGLLMETNEGLTSMRVAQSIDAYQARIESASKAGKASAAKRKSKAISTTVERTLNNRSTNKIKENKIGAEPCSAQPLKPENGFGCKDAEPFQAEDYDFTIDTDELMRELVANG